MNSKIYITLLQKTFQYPWAVKLLKPYWRKQNQDSGISATGFCYIATEALYHLINDNNYFSMVATYYKNGIRQTHWWLQSNDGKILDPTKEQYLQLGLTPPYEIGRRCKFLTKLPSKRAKKLIEYVATYEF